jgi:hypothetical protein
MEQQNYTTQQQTPNFQQPISVPNSTSVLVLGILSIVICWCYGVVGIILAIIALIQAKRGMESYNMNPGMYSLASLNNLKAGKVCAIIGMIISALMLLYVIFWIVLFGSIMTSLPWHEFENMRYY